MTVDANKTKIALPGNGVATDFDFDFKVLDSDELQIWLYDSVTEVSTEITTNFTVELNSEQDDDPGGTVSYPTSGDPLAATGTMTIARAGDFKQDTDVTNNQSFNAEVMEEVFDIAAMERQQLQETTERCLKVAITSDEDATPDALMEELNDAVAAAQLAETGAEAALVDCEAEVVNCQDEVVLAAAQVALAADQVTLAEGHADDADTARIAAEAAQAAAEVARDEAEAAATQPAFLVQKATQQSNISVGSEVTVTFDTEIVDRTDNFASNTFTAPVGGVYQLNVNVHLLSIPDGAGTSDILGVYIQSSNRAYRSKLRQLWPQNVVRENMTVSFSVVADMDANDTVYLTVIQSVGDANTDIGGTTNQDNTNFSGHYVT